jgi:excisionase family DNA binding protein
VDARRLQIALAIARENPGAVAGTIPAVKARKKMDQLLYTVSECCRLLAIGRTKFYEIAAAGAIPIRKIGQKTVVTSADLKRYADSLPSIENKRRSQLHVELDGAEGQGKARMSAPAQSEADLTESDRG